MMEDARLDPLLNNPIIRALLAGGMMLPVNPSGARTDTPGGPAVNVYESGGNVILQIFSPTAGAWKSVTLS